MSGRGNDTHMGTNHPREPFPLHITFTLRSPPNPIDVFPTSAAKITLRTIFAANREKNCQRTHSMPTNIPTYRRDPAKATFWLSVQPSMLTLAGTGGRLMQPPSGFPRIKATAHWAFGANIPLSRWGFERFLLAWVPKSNHLSAEFPTVHGKFGRFGHRFGTSDFSALAEKKSDRTNFSRRNADSCDRKW